MTTAFPRRLRTTPDLYNRVMTGVGDYYERPEVVESYRSDGELSAAEAVLIERYVEPGDVLELGTGGGRVALALAQLGHRVTAVDLSHAMIANAAATADRLGLEVSFAVGDATALQFAGDTFAATLFLGNGIGHLPRSAMARCLSEMRRVTRPGGPVLLSFRTPYALNRMLPGLIVRSVTRRGESRDESLSDGVYVDRPSARTMRRLIRESGLEIVEETTLRAAARDPRPLDRLVGGQLFVVARS